jgi:hypothetical protein
MRHGLYAHPWDLTALDEDGGLTRVAALGFGDVSMAVTDYGGRMLRAWTNGGVVRDLEGGVVHFAPRGDYGRLRPIPSAEVRAGEASPLEHLIDGCRTAGLDAWAWARPLRNPRLGDRFPTACVVNAFGDRYRTVLCPAQPVVQEYVLQMVDDIADHAGLHGIELEAIGFADHRRGGARTAEALPPDPYVDFLLSVCFCPDCNDSVARTGLDGERLRGHVRDLVRRRLVAADVLAPMTRRPSHEEVFRTLEADLGNAGMFALWSHRLSVYMRLLTRIREVVAGRCRIALHVNFHSLFAGDAIGAPLQVVQNHADELIVSHLFETPDQVRQAWRGQPADKVAIRAAIQPKPPAYRSLDDLWAVREAVKDAGGKGLKVHHLGLLPWPTIERVAAVLRETVPGGRARVLR